MSQPTFSFGTTADEVATFLADEIRGKNGSEQSYIRVAALNFFAVLITGTSLNGIGFETARVLAKFANLVVITGHNADRFNCLSNVTVPLFT
jgi:hypothetical protein